MNNQPRKTPKLSNDAARLLQLILPPLLADWEIGRQAHRPAWDSQSIPGGDGGSLPAGPQNNDLCLYDHSVPLTNHQR